MSKAVEVLTESEKQRLMRLLETAPLAEIADEMGGYYKRLRKNGLTKWQAWALTYELHAHLCAAVFPDLR